MPRLPVMSVLCDLTISWSLHYVTTEKQDITLLSLLPLALVVTYLHIHKHKLVFLTYFNI